MPSSFSSVQIRDATKLAGFSKVSICPLSLAVARAHWKFYHQGKQQEYSNCIVKEVSLYDSYMSDVQISNHTFTEVSLKRIRQLWDPEEPVDDFDKWRVLKSETCIARR